MRLRFLRNYLVEIWLFLVAAIVLTIVLLSFFLYRSFQSSTIETINRLNQDSLMETGRINEYVRRTIRTSGMELFSEPSIRRLMYDTDLTNFEVLTGIRRIDSVQSMERYIQSIYVFNAAAEYIYTTSDHTSASVADFQDRGVLDLLYSDEDPRGLLPIARYAASGTKAVPVHTFVFYETSSFVPEPRGALVINITLDWLREIVEEGASDLYVVDRTGTVIYNTDHDRFLSSMIEEPFVRRALQSESPTGAFVDTVGGQRMLVLFATSDDLCFVRTFPHEEVFAEIYHMRRNTLVVVAGVLAFGASVAFAFSRRLYRPIRKIAQTVRKIDPSSSLVTNPGDIAHLSTAIESIAARTTSLEAVSVAQAAVLRQEVLKAILSGELPVQDTGDAVFAEYGLPFTGTDPYRIVAAVGNAGREPPTIPDTCRCCVTTVGSLDTIVMQGATGEDERALAGQLQALGARLVVLSGEVESAQLLPPAFARVRDAARFSFMFPEGHIARLSGRPEEPAPFVYDAELENQILHCVRLGDVRSATGLLEEFVARMSAYRYELFRFALRRLYVSTHALRQRFAEQGNGGSRAFMVGLEELPEEPRTLEDLLAPFRTLFADCVTAVSESREARHREVAHSVHAFIAQNFSDPALSTQQIADHVELSSAYLSRVFRDVEQSSIADAINQYRIEIAKRMLVEETVPAREIAARVGFTNENYFYTLFRKHVGLTPAAFRREHSSSFKY